jgi:hypothetical protein
MHVRQRWLVAFLWVIVILSSSLRLYKFGSIPTSLYWDEIAMLVDSRSIISTGKDFHGNTWLQPIYPSYGDFKLGMYIVLSAPLTLLPVSFEAQIRLLNLLAYFCTGIVLFYMSKILFRKINGSSTNATSLIQPLVLFVYAVAPWSFHFSRTGFEGFLAQFFLSLGVLLLLLSEKKTWLVFVGAVVGSLSILTYYSSLYVWPIVAFCTLMYLALSSTHRLHKSKIPVLFFRLLIIVSITLITALLLKQSPFYDDMQLIRLSTSSVLDPVPFIQDAAADRVEAGNTPLDRLLYFGKLYQLKALIHNVETFIHPAYIFVHGDQNLRHGTQVFGLFLWPFVLFLFGGIYYLVQKHWQTGCLLITWWCVSLLPAAVPLDVPHSLRSLNALVPLTLLLGFGAYFSITHRRRWLRWTGYSVIAMSTIVFISFALHYFLVYPFNSAIAWQDGYASLARFIADQRKDAPVVEVIHPDGRFFLWYLIYGAVTPTTIQASPQKNYNLESIDSVRFNAAPIDSVLHSSSKVLLIAPRDALPASISASIPHTERTIPMRYVLIDTK